MLEHGTYLGYDVIGYYQVQSQGSTVSDNSEQTYILMGAQANLSSSCAALLAVVSLYVTMAF